MCVLPGILTESGSNCYCHSKSNFICCHRRLKLFSLLIPLKLTIVPCNINTLKLLWVVLFSEYIKLLEAWAFNFMISSLKYYGSVLSLTTFSPSSSIFWIIMIDLILALKIEICGLKIWYHSWTISILLNHRCLYPKSKKSTSFSVW